MLYHFYLFSVLFRQTHARKRRDTENLPGGKGRYELPAGFRKELELFNLHRVKHCRHLVVVEGYFGAIRLHGADPTERGGVKIPH